MTGDLLPSGSGTTTAGGRRAAMRRKRRRQRRQRVGAALAVAVLLTIGVTVYLVQDDDPPPGAAVDPGRTQRTVLMQVRSGSGYTATNTLLAHDPQDASGAAVLVPPQVLATPPGGQAETLGDVLRTGSPASARNAVADLVGVTVDASWVLSRTGAEALVDKVGGISVEVDVPVLGGVDRRTVLLQPGAQRVAGAAALAFASYLGEGEQEQARLARVQELVDGVLEQLPDSPTQMIALLDTLGRGSSVDGFDTTQLAALLLGLRADQQAESLQFDTLPVSPVETGAERPSLILDAEASAALVDRLLAQSVPPGVREGNNRVKVFNGVGTPGLGSRVRDRLVADGLVYVPGGNAQAFGVRTTEIQIGEPTEAAQALGRRVAAALGVPEDAIRSSPPTSVADVIVVVGADFQAG